MIRFTISDPDSIEYVADWVELFTILNGSPISKSTLTSHLSLEMGEDPDSCFIDDVWLELEYRNQLYGSRPPYDVNSRSITPMITKKGNPEYVMCLLLSILGNSENTTNTGKLFERLSGEAIRNYIKGRVIIYGYPSKQTVQNIANFTHERLNFRPPRNFKDRGLDIIAWKSFDDNRCGQIVILFQCASGNNWRSKLLSVPIDAWGKYIAWGSNPLKGFTLPRIIRKDMFDECSYEAGIIIDRARIYRNIIGQEIDPALRHDLKTWCDNKIQGRC